MNWHELKVSKVNEIIAINKKGDKVATLEEFKEEVFVDLEKEIYSNVVGQDSLTRFDQPKRSNKKRRNTNNKNRKRQPAKADTGAGTGAKATATGNKPTPRNNNKKRRNNNNKPRPNNNQKQGPKKDA
jgi:hypothetical protein